MPAVLPSFIPFRKYVAIALGVNLITILLGILAQTILPPEIPLFYGLATGSLQLAPSQAILVPPAVSTLIIVVNLGLVKKIGEEFAQKALVLTAIAATAFSTITTLKIILLVGSF